MKFKEKLEEEQMKEAKTAMTVKPLEVQKNRYKNWKVSFGLFSWEDMGKLENRSDQGQKSDSSE